MEIILNKCPLKLLKLHTFVKNTAEIKIKKNENELLAELKSARDAKSEDFKCPRMF